MSGVLAALAWSSFGSMHKMKTFARIESGMVVELFETDGDIKEMFHPSMVWVDGAGASVGDSYENGVFSTPNNSQPTADQKIDAAESAIQSMLDDGAKAKGYDSILSAASYAALPVGESFQAEGAAFLLWRAKCWAKCYAILADVKSGKRAEPADLIAEMPALLLP